MEALKTDKNGVTRMLYAIEQALTDKALTDDDSINRSRNFIIRVPVFKEVYKSAFTWLFILDSQIDQAMIRMLFFPTNFAWCDLILGKPALSEYNSIRIPLENIPFAHADSNIKPTPKFTALIDSKLTPCFRNNLDKKIPRIIRAKKRRKADDPKIPTIRSIVTDSIREQKRDIHNRLSPRLLIGSALVLSLLGLIIFLKLAGSHKEPQSIENIPIAKNSPHENWKALCLAYHLWFRSFQDNLSNDRRTAWQQNSQLAEALEFLDRIESEKRVIDPVKIVDEKGSYITLAEISPPNLNSDIFQQTIEEGFETVQTIENILLNVKASAISSLEEKQKQFKAFGWDRPAELVKQLNQDFKKTITI